MSAWLVSKRTIDCLTTASIALGIAEKSEADEFGEMLLAENCRSLMARYDDRYEKDGGDLPDPGTYRYEPYGTEDLYFVTKQVDCYDYQACEHPDYAKSRACAVVEELLRRIPVALGLLVIRDVRENSLYEEASWGVRGEES